MGLPREYHQAELKPALLAHLMDQELLAQRMAPLRKRYEWLIHTRRTEVAKTFLGASFDAVPLSEKDLIDSYLSHDGRDMLFDLSVTTLQTARELERLISNERSLEQAVKSLGLEDSLTETNSLRPKDLDLTFLYPALALL